MSDKEKLQELQAQFDALKLELQTTLQEKARLAEPEVKSTSQLTATVCKVSPKLPPIWQQKPAMWFAHIETQFRVAGITADQTKFDHVIGQFDYKITAEIEDIILNPPEKDKYDHLKKEVIRRLSQSEEERVRRLLSEQELGDRKPTQFLRHLRSLSENVLKDEGILRQLFMRGLPLHLQAILAASSDPLDDIAARGDKILEVVPSTATNPIGFVHAAGAASDVADPFGFKAFATQMQTLTATVAALSTDRNSRSRTPTPGNRSRSHSRSSASGTANQKICWYHKTFNNKATKCISPCSWSKENSTDSQ